MDRIYILGASGSGKSTLAGKLSEKLNIQKQDLDESFWSHGPAWAPVPQDTFLAKVKEATSGDRWILEGAQEEAKKIILPKADTLIWVDPSLARLFSQLCVRTYNRIVQKTPICNGKIETWSNSLLSSNSIFVWAAKTYVENKTELSPVFNSAANPEKYGHLRLIRLDSRQAVDNFVLNLDSPK